MSISVYIEKTVGMNHEKAFEAVKRAILEKYICRVVKEEPPYLLVVEQIPAPWKYRLHEVAKYIVFYLYPIERNLTNVTVVSILHHELVKRMFYIYIVLGAVAIFFYYMTLTLIASYGYQALENPLLGLLIIMPGAIVAGIVIAGLLDYEVYRHKDEVAKSIINALG